MIHSKLYLEAIRLRWRLKTNFLALIILLLSFNSLLAQNLKVNLSPRHIARVENTKSAVVKLKKYRRYFTQDSARHLKRLDKMYDKKSDSITKVMLTNEKLRLLREKNGIKEPVDTLALLQQYASLLPVDSTVDNVLLALVGVLHQQAIVSKFYIVWRI